MSNKNIVLIGMPSSGKSTIAKILSEKLNLIFLDTDNLVLNKLNKPLKDYVKENGRDKFLKIQEDTILETHFQNNIVATGGSVIYNQKAMNYFQENSIIIYLKSEFNDIEKRLAKGRSFARNEGQSLKDLFEERVPLYERYSEISINCSNKLPDEIANEIVDFIRRN